MTQLDGTLVLLKKQGANKIILFGPMPFWDPPLPKALFSFFKNDPMHRLPERMWYGLRTKLITDDKYLHEKADKLGIIYVSPFNELCNAEGCLTRVGDNPEDLIAWDEHHFTPSASRYFIDKVFSKLPLT